MRRDVLIALAIFTAIALLYTGLGFLPNRVFAPLDITRDFDAWKRDPNVRVRVSNRILSDVAVQFVPWDAEIVRLARAGEMPWRNQWAADGAPLFANPQTAMFSPFTWPRFVFGLRGWAITALLRLVVAMLMMYWLARVMRAAHAAALISGIVYGTSAFGICWLLYPHANVFAIVPGLAASSVMLACERSARNVLLVVLCAALATAGGHPETLFVSVIAIFALLVMECGGRAAALGRVAIAQLAGFLLLGAQLVPFAKLLLDSDARIARASGATLGFRWTALVAQIIPGFLGSPLRNEIDLTALLPIPENFTTRNLSFIGFVIMVAVVARSRGRAVVIALVAYLLALRLPFVTQAFQKVPILGWSAIEYWTVPFVLFASLAAGPALLELTGRRKGIAVAIAGALLMIGGLVVALPAARPLLTSTARSGIEHLQARGFLHQPAAVYEARLATYVASAGTTALKRAAIPGACWLVAGIALVTNRRRLLVAAALAELILFGIGFNPAIDRREIPGPPAIPRDGMIASNIEVFPSNLGTQYHVRDVNSYDVLTSAARIQAFLPAGYDRATHGFPAEPTAAQLAVLAKLGVRYYVAKSGVIEISRATLPPPRNDPPEWLGWGIATSIAGAVIAAASAGRGSRRGSTPNP
ncbi:MAG TPA: hypothetical protein VMU84_15120 [Thermoanaerobaculia bacterium]|nr:hypothetical protein [Thermoanaerobaculia bacterium]